MIDHTRFKAVERKRPTVTTYEVYYLMGHCWPVWKFKVEKMKVERLDDNCFPTKREAVAAGKAMVLRRLTHDIKDTKRAIKNMHKYLARAERELSKRSKHA